MLPMPKKRLTKKEQDTLWSLVNFPMLNDNALAKKTKLKLSTITAIRRRLREKDYYKTVNIPNFYRLGFELFTVEYGTFNEAVPVEQRIENFQRFIESNPNTIFSIMSRSSGIIFNVAKNYAEANQHYEDLEMFFTSHHLTNDEGWSRVIFPFETSLFWNFFDYSPIIRYAFDIKRKINLPEFIPNKTNGSIKLSKKEKKVLIGLVKYPEESDNSIADRYGVSRQAVSNIKRRFIRENLIYTRRIMNFERTGLKLMPFGHTVFGPKAHLALRANGLDFTKKSAPIFLGISSNFENVVFAATLNYPEYDKLKDKMLSFYKTHLSIAKPPETLLFSVEDICYFQQLTFHRLIENIPGMMVE
jgi:DNA-binding MarR family transcriptional regulator